VRVRDDERSYAANDAFGAGYLRAIRAENLLPDGHEYQQPAWWREQYMLGMRCARESGPEGFSR
jgi:hypothetical protein